MDFTWIEHELWCVLKNFVLITFSISITEVDRLKLNTLYSRLNSLLPQVNKDFVPYCKYHHLMHYADLIKLFGSLNQCPTWRMERKHQDSKNIVRRTMNFRNIPLTVHSRLQFRWAIEDRDKDRRCEARETECGFIFD